MKYRNYYTCPRDNHAWSLLGPPEAPSRCPQCKDEVTPYQSDDVPNAPRTALPSDRVAMHTFTQRSKRLAFKQACERSNITMEANINRFMDRFILEEEEIRQGTPAKQVSP